MFTVKKYIHTLLSLLLILPFIAKGNIGPDQYGVTAEQRKLYLQAQQALADDDIATTKKLMSRLKNYPLYPYLVYAELTKRLSSATATEVTAFLTQYPNSPLANRLQEKWQLELAKQEKWPEFLAGYKSTENPQLRCLQATALYNTGEKTLALKKVPDLWLQGKDQPKVCNAIFKHWENSGQLTSERIWQRIELALLANEYQLANYLTKFLPSTAQAQVNAWIQINQYPEKITQANLLTSHPFTPTIIAHGIKKLVAKNDQLGIKTWQQLKKKYPFTPQQTADVEQTIAMALVTDYHASAELWLAKVPEKYTSSALRQWRVRYALSTEDWPAVLKWIKAMPKNEQDEAAWRYWQARALEQTGQTTKAQTLYQALALERHYYGLLSSEKTNQPAPINNKPVTITKDSLKHALQTPGIKRAMELYFFDKVTQARTEWRAVIPTLTPVEQRAAAHIAAQLRWHSEAIFTAGQAHLNNDLALRFPLANKSLMLREARKQGIDPAWTFAITRQESAFIPDAVSSAGALGLMQLLPTTALELAKRYNVTYKGKQTLFNPDTNILLGHVYLKNMYHRYDKNYILATAAYNAGPTPVRRWIPKKDDMSADIWIDTIPYYETRDYLKNVLAFTAIYDYHLGIKPSLNKRMKEIEASL